MPTVLITAANRGIGLEFVRQYLAEGWLVFPACRQPAKANELEGLASGAGKALTVVAMDVTAAKSVGDAARQLKGEAIDLLATAPGSQERQGRKPAQRRLLSRKRMLGPFLSLTTPKVPVCAGSAEHAPGHDKSFPGQPCI